MHKPIALEDFDRDFFSELSGEEKPQTDCGDLSEKESTAVAQTETYNEENESSTDASKNEEASDAVTQTDNENTQKSDTASEADRENEKPLTDCINGMDFSDMPITAAQLKAMLGRDFGKKPDKIFHDLPDDEPKGSTVSEKEAEESFPVIDFDPEKLKPALNEDIEDRKKRREAEKEELKRHKINAKKSIEEEKQKIHAQKKLERNVGRPFKIRKLLAFLLVVFLLLGLVLTGFFGIIFASGLDDGQLPENFRYRSYYADGQRVIWEKAGESVFIVDRQANVQGGKDILIRSENGFAAGSVLLAGGDSYTLDMGNKMQRVTTADVEGCVVLCIPSFRGLSFLVKICTYDIFCAVAILLIYFMSVTAIFVVLIRKQNEKIRKFRESYVLV